MSSSSSIPSPSFTPTDEGPIKRLKNRIQWLLFLRVLVVSLLLGLTALLQTKASEIVMPPYPYLASFIAGVYGISIASALSLKFIDRGYVPFAYVQILADVALTSCLVYYTGCSQSVFTIVYFFPIIAGSLILYRKGGLFFAALASLSYAGVLFLESLGFFPAFFYAYGLVSGKDFLVSMNLFGIYGLSFFLVAIFSSWLSERLKLTEAELTQTTQSYDRLASLYKQIFDDISTGIITVDALHRISSFNNAAQEITGYQKEKIMGRRIADKLPVIGLNTAVNSRLEARLTRPDGKTIPVGYSSTRLRGPDGRGDGWIITIQDLSQIKKMEEKVRQNEKMAAIGEMAAGIAHEFRNPLAAVSGSAQFLAHELTGNPIHQRLMNIIIRESDRLNKSISDFLQFSKPTTPEKNWFSLNGLLDEALEILEKNSAWKERLEIIRDFPATTDCWGDASLLKQVLINIIDNALHAPGEQRGEIWLSVRETVSSAGAEFIILTIADNGPGIAENLLDKIFHPFFTTREDGTGLGLSIVHQIVTSHGGSIDVESVPSKGTTFEISLPLP